MKNIKWSLILIVLMFVFITACSKTTIICADGREVLHRDECYVDTNSDNLENVNLDNINENMVSPDGLIGEEDIVPYFSISNFKYYERSTDPRDSIIKNKYTNRFNTYLSVDYSFNNPDLMKDSKIYLKVVSVQSDSKLNKIVYANELKSGTTNLNLATELKYIGDSPKLMFCFDTNPKFDPESSKATCVKKAFTSPTMKTELRMSTLRYNFDTKRNGETLTDTKYTDLKNTGSVPLTFYIVPEDYLEVKLTPTVDKIFLNPGEEKEFGMTATFIDNGSYKEGTSKVHIYAIPNECSLSLDCASSAVYKTTFVLQFQY